jgi:PAB-dependent poly(A)-specific ribonuclease subunit 3
MQKELENGRLFRLLAKLNFILERREYFQPLLLFFKHVCVNPRFRSDMDPDWSETGDRYLLKLFRDYVFHQTTEDGAPFLDLAHVVMCLNKVRQ